MDKARVLRAVESSYIKEVPDVPRRHSAINP